MIYVESYLYGTKYVKNNFNPFFLEVIMRLLTCALGKVDEVLKLMKCKLIHDLCRILPVWYKIFRKIFRLIFSRSHKVAGGKCLW